MTTLLSVQALTKRFGGVQAVDNFSMELPEGEVVGLIGPNGAGKTTVFNLISKLIEADSGVICLGEQDITRMPSYQVTRLGIARTFQNIRLFTGLNVIDNVKVALGQSQAKYNIIEGLLRLPHVVKQEKLMEQRARELLNLLGIGSHEREQPQSLPYGLQRRLEIARALASNPRLLLLDEPAAGLNPAEVIDITHLIRRINQEFKLSVLLIEHHMDVVMPICHNIYVLNFGKTIAHGSPEQIQSNPEVLSAYLGEEQPIC